MSNAWLPYVQSKTIPFMRYDHLQGRRVVESVRVSSIILLYLTDEDNIDLETRECTCPTMVNNSDIIVNVNVRLITPLFS